VDPISTFAHLLPDTVSYAVVCSTGDAYGEMSYATAVSYKARVVGQQKLIRSFTGDEVLSQHTVYLGAAIVAQPTDQITLSTAIVGSTQDSAIHPPILGAKRIPDQAGTHHGVLYLG
jgi:hypothetical protein